MLPDLFRIPGLGIVLSTYGLLLTAGFIMALSLTTRLAKEDGLPQTKIYELGVYVLLSGLLGTRLLMIFANWRDVVGNWDRFFTFDLIHSVGHYLGGFLTALALSVILVRVWHLPWRKTADAFAPGLALGNVMGRIGCFASGCCWGKVTNSWLGVKFTERAHEINGVPINVALMPTQLIEAGANLGMFALLIWLWKRRAFDGQIILAYMMFYSLERFVVEFWRADPRGQIMNVSTSQFITLFMFPLALTIYSWLRGSLSRALSIPYNN